MPFDKPKLSELLNESDVEQKFVLPFLVAEKPYGLGIARENVVTKRNVRKFVIDKGTNQKSYFPDYLVVKANLPLLVIEVKERGGDLDEAFREARLYAAEMNSMFPAKLNPLSRAIAVNGDQLFAGFYDQAKPLLTLSHAEIDPYSAKLAEFYQFCGAETLRGRFCSSKRTDKAATILEAAEVGRRGIRTERRCG